MDRIKITRIKKILIITMPVVVFLSLSKAALAADPAKEDTATIPTDLIISWKGSFQVAAISVLRDPEKTLSEYVANYIGSEDKNSLGYKNYKYNPEKIYAWLNQLSEKINIEPKAGKLEIENDRAVNFTAPQIGKTLNVYQTTVKALSIFEKGGNVVPLVIDKTEVGNLEKTNQLGIKELIGHGISNFSGSPSNRRHNIKIGVAKMKGVIIGPDEEFSFNKYLGPVEADQGFLPELVIKGNDTIPELGGGLCQVSSTTFRAAMDAGLNITQRRNHAYAVKYYAPQGTDATIYPGVIDLKFRNDTGHSILVWPYFPDNNTLVFDFYGTKDDRKVSLTTPVQYDKNSDGSMKATWTKTVTKNGETTKQTFNSIYKPPALFHKQEKFVPASPENSTTPPPFKPISTEPTSTNPPTNSQTPPNNNSQP